MRLKVLNRLEISALGVNLGWKVRRHWEGSVATISPDPHIEKPDKRQIASVLELKKCREKEV